MVHANAAIASVMYVSMLDLPRSHLHASLTASSLSLSLHMHMSVDMYACFNNRRRPRLTTSIAFEAGLADSGVAWFCESQRCFASRWRSWVSNLSACERHLGCRPSFNNITECAMLSRDRPVRFSTVARTEPTMTQANEDGAR